MRNIDKEIDLMIERALSSFNSQSSPPRVENTLTVVPNNNEQLDDSYSGKQVFSVLPTCPDLVEEEEEEEEQEEDNEMVPIMNQDNLKERINQIHEYYKYSYNPKLDIIVRGTFEYFELMYEFGMTQENSTIIFDIDDTLLSTYPPHKKGYIQFLVNHYSNDGTTSNSNNNHLNEKDNLMLKLLDDYYPPIPQTVSLYNRLKSLGIKLIIITGRYAEYRETTLDNLRLIGVNDWEQAIFREGDERFLPAQEYKSNRREQLGGPEGKYDIIGSIGDQNSDLYGPYSGHIVKIPNPMYTIL